MSLKLLYFRADWCGPCSQQGDIIADIDAVETEKINVDENQDRANDYTVRSLPTMILLDDGEPVERWSGLTQASEILNTVENQR